MSSNGNPITVTPVHVERVYHALVGVLRRRRVHEGYPAHFDDPFAEGILWTLACAAVEPFVQLYAMTDSEWMVDHPRRCARCFEAAIDGLVDRLNAIDVTEEVDLEEVLRKLEDGGE